MIDFCRIQQCLTISLHNDHWNPDDDDDDDDDDDNVDDDGDDFYAIKMIANHFYY